MEKSSQQVAKEALAQLKKKSPKSTGKYAKGWSRRKVKDEIVLYNKDRYWLTQLLEHDHPLRNGGRSKPVKHIGPIDDWVQEEMGKRFEKEFK